MFTVPPCGDYITAHKYLQEGIHLLLDPIDKPPLDDQAVRGKTVYIVLIQELLKVILHQI